MPVAQPEVRVSPFSEMHVKFSLMIKRCAGPVDVFVTKSASSSFEIYKRCQK